MTTKPPIVISPIIDPGDILPPLPDLSDGLYPIGPGPDRDDDPGYSSPGASITDRSLTSNSTSESIPIIYGAVTDVGADVIYRKICSDGRLLMVYRIGYGPLNSVSNVRIDGKTLAELALTVTTDYVIYTGTSSQTLCTLISAQEAQWVSALPGIAYVAIKFLPPSEAIPQVDPYAFLCDVQGLLIRDPRTDATLVNRYYRDNVALVLADVMTSRRYGAGIADAQVDWATSVTASANDCDVDIGGGVKRFRIGIVLRERGSLDSVKNTIRAHAQLFVAFNSGIYMILMDKAGAASGIVYDDTPGANDNLLDGCSLRVKGAAEVPTHVIVNFPDTATGKDGKAEVIHPNVPLGTMEERVATYSLQGCPTYDQAKRLAMYIYNRAQLDKEVTLLVDATGLRPLPGTIVAVTSTELNLSSQLVIVKDLDPQNGGSQWRISAELYDAAAYSDTIQATTVAIQPSIPSPFDAPPDVLAPGGDPSNYALYWGAPLNRSNTRYDTTHWGSSGLLGYDGTKVNDGDTSAAAFNFNGVGAMQLLFDAGAGNTKAFCECIITTSRSLGNAPTIEYYIAPLWIAVTPTFTSGWAIGAAANRYVVQWAAGVNVRSWRINKSDALAQDTTFTEVQFNEYGDSYAYVERYKIYTTQGGTKKLWLELPANKLPTSGEPLDTHGLVAYTDSRRPDGGGTQTWDLKCIISVVGRSKRESIGIPYNFTTNATPAATGLPATYIPQAATTLTLANGANNNVVLNANDCIFDITGPTGAFSITGLNPGTNRVIWIVNSTAQIMTLTNESVSSVAANRITVLSGATLAIAAGGIVGLTYSSAASRWILFAARDSTGAH